MRASVLVLVGARDETVPPSLSRRVFDAAAEPKRFVEVAAVHHNDPALSAGEELVAEVSAFLEDWVRPVRSGAPLRISPGGRNGSSAADLASGGTFGG